jgi:hypothetical protein
LTGHFRHYPGAQTPDSFSQQVFEIASGILNLMENAFDPLPDFGQPIVKIFRVLNILVAAFWRPNEIISLIKDAGLPFKADKPLSAKISQLER